MSERGPHPHDDTAHEAQGEHHEGHRHEAEATLRWLAVAAALAIIGAATLTPQLPNPHLPPWYQPFTGAGDLADALLNIGLFVPLGIALGIARVGRGRAIVIALATTVTVELLQGLVIPGRQASVGDVVMNVLGGWLGHAIARGTVAAVRADARQARRLAMDYAAAWLLATLVTAALLRPAIPVAGGAYRGRCGEGDLPACFPGQLARPAALREPGRREVAIVEGARLPVGREPTLVVEIVDGGIAYQPGRIAGLSTTPGGALLMLEQRSDWLLFLARTQGANWGLRSPAVVLRGVLGHPGRHVVATAGVSGTARWLETGGRRAELRLSAAEGWRLFFPWSALKDDIIRTVGALFHAICLIPLAFWLARRSGRERGRAVLAGVVPTMVGAAVAFIGGGLLLGLAPTRATDWLGALAGAVVGALLAGSVGVATGRRTGGARGDGTHARDEDASRGRRVAGVGATG